MAYIGRQPTIGNYVKCSDLTADGSTTTFNLTSSTTGLAVVPGSANNMIVSVSGVIQNPGTAYTVADSQITFTTAPGISDTIDFVVILGDAIAIGEPSDNTVTNAKIVDGTIQNAKLANNSITINGTSINLGASGTIVAGTDWQSVVVADGSTGLTAAAGKGYFIDTTSGTQTVTLPNDASSTRGDTIVIRDYAGTFATNNVTLTSTAKISGADADGFLSTNDLVVTLVYVDSTKGWVTIENEAKAVGAQDLLLTATGGTVTESGNYRIHTFTGDGCFVVSDISPLSPGDVDYLVVAGGGGSAWFRGGGGGAGGYRESHCSTTSGCYTASPLASATSLPVSATTYPITVGGGGAGGANGPAPTGPSYTPASQGTPSSFSTITSTGGGYGSIYGNPIGPAGGPGGSGGGAGSPENAPGTPTPGGTGNTPPVSPPQGNPGGTMSGGPGGTVAAGGGGATAAGGNACAGAPSSPGLGGSGGTGATSSINGTPTARAGGGGGGSQWNVNTPGNSGGGNGGGCISAGSSTNGTANTGGGAGGGGGFPSSTAASGGSGIVIIRYKYQ